MAPHLAVWPRQVIAGLDLASLTFFSLSVMSILLVFGYEANFGSGTGNWVEGTLLRNPRFASHVFTRCGGYMSFFFFFLFPLLSNSASRKSLSSTSPAPRLNSLSLPLVIRSSVNSRAWPSRCLFCRHLAQPSFHKLELTIG